MREKSILTIILDFVYTKSKQPVLLKDLLITSAQHNNGLEADSTRLGFRLRLTRAYFVYIALVLSVIVPISLLTHKPLAKIDSHISILGGMIITAFIFMGFNYFIAFLKNSMIKQSIKKAWGLHFPFFAYDEYVLKVNDIFEQAIKEEVSKRDLHKYIIDRLSTL